MLTFYTVDLPPCRPLTVTVDEDRLVTRQVIDVVKQHALVTLDMNGQTASPGDTAASTLVVKTVETHTDCSHF